MKQRRSQTQKGVFGSDSKMKQRRSSNIKRKIWGRHNGWLEVSGIGNGLIMKGLKTLVLMCRAGFLTGLSLAVNVSMVESDQEGSLSGWSAAEA